MILTVDGRRSLVIGAGDGFDEHGGEYADTDFAHF